MILHCVCLLSNLLFLIAFLIMWCVAFAGLFAQVHIHELGCEGIAKIHAFHGKKDYTSKQVQSLLNLSGGGAGAAAVGGVGRPQTQQPLGQQQQPQHTEPSSYRYVMLPGRVCVCVRACVRVCVCMCVCTVVNSCCM